MKPVRMRQARDGARRVELVHAPWGELYYKGKPTEEVSISLRHIQFKVEK